MKQKIQQSVNFEKERQKTKKKHLSMPFAKMPFTVCVKDGSDYVKI